MLPLALNINIYHSTGFLKIKLGMQIGTFRYALGMHVGLFLGFVLIEDTRFNINNEHFTCICTLFI